MIDEEETFRCFGYYSTNLSPKSGKKIVAVCDNCGKVRIVKKQDYRNLCHICSNKDKENIEKRRRSHLGGERISDEDLYKYYITEMKTTIQIAKIVGVSSPTISKWLRESDIKIRNRRERNIGSNNPNWKGGYKTLACDYCDKIIEKRRSEIGNHNFCSKKCEGKWISKNLKGDKSPSFGRKHTKEEIEKQSKSIKKAYENKRWNKQAYNLIDGKPIQDFISTMVNNYNITLEDYDNWRKTIYKRDNYTCQICGKNHCMIHAHHIIPKRDNKDLMLDIDNGITLCKSCHEKTYGKEELFVKKLQMIIKNKRR